MIIFGKDPFVLTWTGVILTLSLWLLAVIFIKSSIKYVFENKKKGKPTLGKAPKAMVPNLGLASILAVLFIFLSNFHYTLIKDGIEWRWMVEWKWPYVAWLVVIFFGYVSFYFDRRMLKRSKRKAKLLTDWTLGSSGS